MDVVRPERMFCRSRPKQPPLVTPAPAALAPIVDALLERVFPPLPAAGCPYPYRVGLSDGADCNKWVPRTILPPETSSLKNLRN